MNRKVYVVHGWTYNLDKWTEFNKLLKDHGVDVVMLKVPGLTAPSNLSYTMDDYVAWLADELKNIKDPVVIGHSNGGRIVLSFIQKYPTKIRQLILIDSAGIANNGGRSRVRLKILKAVAKIGKVFSFIPGLKPLFYKAIGAQDYLNAPENMKITLRNMLAADKLIDLANIKVPTLLIWGRDDQLTPLSGGQELHKGIIGSELRVIDGARHAPNATHPEEVAKIILDRLK